MTAPPTNQQKKGSNDCENRSFRHRVVQAGGMLEFLTIYDLQQPRSVKNNLSILAGVNSL
jgi:hypothetical protein